MYEYKKIFLFLKYFWHGSEITKKVGKTEIEHAGGGEVQVINHKQNLSHGHFLGNVSFYMIH